MTNDERDKLIRETHDAMLSLRGMVQDHHKSLYGNGRPGVSDRVLVVESAVATVAKAQAECPAREAITGPARRSILQNYIAAAAAIIAALAALAASLP